jgi:hypothetical protein
MPPPIALTDQQFTQLMTTSYTIPCLLRGMYLTRVAELLRGRPLEEEFSPSASHGVGSQAKAEPTAAKHELPRPAAAQLEVDRADETADTKLKVGVYRS